MAKKEDILKLNEKEKSNVVIPEIPKLKLEDEDSEIVFPRKEEAFLVAIEYQRQNPQIKECEIKEFFSLQFGNYFKIIPYDKNGKEIYNLPVDLLIEINKKSKMIAEFQNKKK